MAAVTLLYGAATIDVIDTNNKWNPKQLLLPYSYRYDHLLTDDEENPSSLCLRTLIVLYDTDDK